MRNIFDFYSQAENQLTHALFSTLAYERDLLKDFVRNVCEVRGVRTEDLNVSVQSYPSARAYTDEEIKGRSIPDAWIYTNDFALVFEAKITAPVTRAQLTSHVATAQKQGFDNPRFFTITADPNARTFEGWQNIRWCDIYTWLRGHETTYPFARQAADYFEILEVQMHTQKSLKDIRMTNFTGFFPYYENVYNHGLAKSSLRKATSELCNRADLMENLGVSPAANRRQAIKEQKGKSVWDFLLISDVAEGKNFTNYLHLTLGVNETLVEALVTVPDKIITTQKNKIKELDGDGFIGLCKRIFDGMETILEENPGAQPMLRAQQRRYPSRGSKSPFMDGLIEADLRTAFTNDYGIKHHEEWLRMAYDIFSNKGGANYEFQIGINFPYDKCEQIKDERALDLIAQAWLACKPLVELCHQDPE